MSREVLEEILARATEDDMFRARLLRQPAEALDGYALSTHELQAFLTGDLRELLLSVGDGDES
jgi:hypothetical protein